MSTHPRRESPEVKARPALGGVVHSIDPLLHLVGGHPAVIVSDDRDRAPVAVGIGQERAVQVSSHERRCRLLVNCSTYGASEAAATLLRASLAPCLGSLNQGSIGEDSSDCRATAAHAGHHQMAGVGAPCRQAGDLKFSGGDGSGQFGRGHGRAVSVALVL